MLSLLLIKPDAVYITGPWDFLAQLIPKQTSTIEIVLTSKVNTGWNATQWMCRICKRSCVPLIVHGLSLLSLGSIFSDGIVY